MKVCVTGAGGSLGGTVHYLLHQAGYEVAATDFMRRRSFPLPVKVANLCDREAIYEFVEGADALVHIGNHPNPFRADPQTLYTENVAMNMHAFHAAVESGVDRIIFASSIQAMAPYDHFKRETVGTYDALPVPSGAPPRPTNTYGLSKCAGEQILDFATSMMPGVHAASLRFTELRTSNDLSPNEYLDDEFWTTKFPAEFFSFCTFQRAARLVQHLLERDPWEGHRVFQVAFKEPRFDIPVPELIERFYPDVTLNKPREEMEALWDFEDLERFSGWDSSRLAHTEEDDELGRSVGLRWRKR